MFAIVRAILPAFALETGYWLLAAGNFSKQVFP